MKLEEKVAVITGAARGIGKAIAMRFASEGATVVLIDRDDTTSLAEQLARTKVRAIPVKLDITDYDRVLDRIDKIAAELKTIDILVNNAGIIARGTIDTLTYETWRTVLDVNLNGTFNCCKAVVPHMKRQQYGRILNITSIAGKMGDISAAPVYGASKGAINTLTRSLARQLAGSHITVNAIAPHAVTTDMSAQWSDKQREEIIASIPLNRLAAPEEIAEAALFLVSDGAGFITGEVLNVNGGALMD